MLMSIRNHLREKLMAFSSKQDKGFFLCFPAAMFVVSLGWSRNALGGSALSDEPKRRLRRSLPRLDFRRSLGPEYFNK